MQKAKQGDVFINNKTGDEYAIIGSHIINATNANDGQVMIGYHRDNNQYVREISEFFEKFTKVDDNTIGNLI